jgi:WD40 repeat protein
MSAGSLLDPLITDNQLKEKDLPLWEAFPATSSTAVTAHAGQVLALRETSPARHQIATLGADGMVVGWDLSTGRGYRLKVIGQQLDVGALGSEHALMAYAVGQEIHVACLADCNREWVLRRLKVKPLSITFHADDSALVIGGADGRVYQWRFLAEASAPSAEEAEKALERYVAHQSVISVVASHPFGRAFFSGDWHGQLYAWLPYTADDYQGEYNKNYFGARGLTAPETYTRAERSGDRGIVSMNVSGNGDRLALGSEDGYVEVWEVKGFTLAARERRHKGRVFSVAINEDGTKIASASRDGTVSVNAVIPDATFRIAPDTHPFKLDTIATYPLPNVRSVYFISDGRLLAATEEGKLAEISVPSYTPASPTSAPETTPKDDERPKDTDY